MGADAVVGLGWSGDRAYGTAVLTEPRVGVVEPQDEEG
jgi:hypothetical protein